MLRAGVLLLPMLLAAADTLGRIGDPALNECSGLARSRRFADLVWACNDSGSQPVLYGLGLDGRRRRQVTIDNASALDWEDLAAWTASDGSGMVLFADCGDNLAVRPCIALGAIAESSLTETDTDQRVAPVWQALLRFSEGAADLEAVAIDERDRQVLLVTKRLERNRVYAIPLAVLVRGGLHTVTAVATLPRLPDHGDGSSNPGGQPTAMDVDAQGRLALSTYRWLYRWDRAVGEDWPAALAREPQRFAAPKLPQFEACCWLADGRVLLGSEGRNQPLLALTVLEPRQ